jgi:hypothetical protein
LQNTNIDLYALNNTLKREGREKKILKGQTGDLLLFHAIKSMLWWYLYIKCEEEFRKYPATQKKVSAKCRLRIIDHCPIVREENLQGLLTRIFFIKEAL